MVVFYTFSSDKTVNNREKMALLCALRILLMAISNHKGVVL